jgi:REP element-mobilizing transposase RayT
MPDERHGAYTGYKTHLHQVWKHNISALPYVAKLSTRLCGCMRKICAQDDVIIITNHTSHVAKDHVHHFVCIPPQVTISLWCNGSYSHRR